MVHNKIDKVINLLDSLKAPANFFSNGKAVSVDVQSKIVQIENEIDGLLKEIDLSLQELNIL